MRLLRPLRGFLVQATRASARFASTAARRVLWWVPEAGCVDFEADTRHTEVVLKSLGLDELEQAAPLETPAIERAKGDELALLAGAHPLKLYRSVVMQVSSVAQDRQCLSSVAGSLACGMRASTTEHMQEFKRVGRYLRGSPVGTLVFRALELHDALEVLRDARRGPRDVSFSVRHGSHVGFASADVWQRGAEHDRAQQRRLGVVFVVAGSLARARREVDVAGLAM